jgi:MFS family permease
MPPRQATPSSHRRLPILPAGWALAGAAVAFTTMYVAAGALTPLLVVYRQEWQFPASELTLAFAVYAVGFLAGVLTLGPLSDHVGRRPVLLGALVLQLASNVLLSLASGIDWVIAGRVVQGLATGVATSAFTAVLVEVAPADRKRLGATLGSVTVTAGLALGSLLAGVAIQLTTSANAICFLVLSAMRCSRASAPCSAWNLIARRWRASSRKWRAAEGWSRRAERRPSSWPSTSQGSTS